LIIESISLFNVGVFRGKHTIDLAPMAPGSPPIVLIGGQNGRGKTTLLDSIHFGLYGRAARLAKRGDLTWDEYLIGLIHRHAPSSDGAAITLVMRYNAEGEEHKIKVLRDWKALGGRVKDTLTVWRNDVISADLAEDWVEFVENIIPSRIAHLFLFDGEQISALADPEQSREILRTGVHSLLGADLVDRLDKDLLALGRRYKMQAAPTEEVEAVQKLESDLVLTHQKIAGIEEELRQRHEERQRLLATRDKLQGDLQAQGGHLVELRGALDQEERMVKQRIEELESERRHLLGGVLPLAGLTPILDEMADQAAKEQAVIGGAELLSKLEERDARLIKILKEDGLTKGVLAGVIQRLTEDRRHLSDQLRGADTVLNLSQKAIAQLMALTGGSLTEATTRYKEKQDQIRKFREKLEIVQRKLARIPDPESVRLVLEEKSSLDWKINECDSRITSLIKDQQDIEASSRMLDRQLQKMTESLHSTRVEHARISRNLDHLGRARATIKSFRSALVQRDIQRIEREILLSAQRLFSKQRLISRVHINPESFQLSIFDSDGNSFSPYQLSAGERQILAISILWGLSKASGKSLPVFIDTPLGRLDHDHRDKLVASYFPNASHQVVLLSTEEEITPPRLKRMAPWVSRVCSLIYDEGILSSRFEPGRFFDECPKTLGDATLMEATR